MAFLHGKKTKIYLAGYDISSYFNEISSTNTVETGETTTFGGSGYAKTYVVGLQDGTISAKGLFDGAALAIDAQLSSILATDVDTHILYGITGLNATNDPVRFGAARPTNYQVSSPVGDVVSASADFQSDGGVQLGIGLVPTTASASGNATSYDGTASSTKGAVYQFHVTANTRSGATTTNLFVYHSADNVTFAALGAGIAIPNTTTGSYRLEIASGTTVNRYVRFQWVVTGGTGSLTFVGAFARR
jgi:hypothetical protein